MNRSNTAAWIARDIFLVLAVSLIFSSNSFAQSNNAVTSATDADGDGIGDRILANPSNSSFIVVNSADDSVSTIEMGTGAGNVPVVGDFNGNDMTDYVSYNRTTAMWTTRFDDGSTSTFSFGSLGDVPAPADYNGDGSMDVATYNPRSGMWTIGNENGGNTSTLALGGPGMWPVPADYDCDGNADPAVFDKVLNRWTVRQSTNSQNVSFFYGLPGDIPMPGDFNGDSCAKPGVHRPTGNFWLLADSFVNGGFGNVESVFQFGLPGDRPFYSNIENDNINDISVFRPLDSNFFTRTDQGGIAITNFGNASFLFPMSAPAIPIPEVPGDYTRDGKSDYAFVQVNRSAGTSTWNVLSGALLAPASAVLSVPGDAMTPGDFDGDGALNPGVVYVRPDANLAWHWIDQLGAEQSALWGLNGDQPITGDFDCDGKDDRAVVRTVGAYKYWYFQFAKGDQQTEFLFGLANDTIYAADIDGDLCDELVVSRSSFGGIDWFYQNLQDEQPTYVQWGLATDETLTPADVNGDGLGDFIIARDVNGQRLVYALLNPELRVFTTYALNGSDPIFLTGQFSGVNYSEFATYTTTGSSGRFLVRRGHFFDDQVNFGNGSQFLVRPDRSAVAPGTSGGFGCALTQDFNDGAGGSLWKPDSDNTGLPVFLLPSSPYYFGPSRIESVEIFGSNGQKVTDGRFRTCCPNGNRTHWDVTMSGSQLRQFAPITVRLNLADGSRECREIADPAARND